MNTNGKLALTVLAGIVLGALSVMAIHAQEAKTPPAYLIAETEIADRDAFQKYAEKVPETLAPFRGSFHYVVRGGKTQALEGQPPKGIVVIAFDSTEKALAWYNSPAYEAIIMGSRKHGSAFVPDDLLRIQKADPEEAIQDF